MGDAAVTLADVGLAVGVFAAALGLAVGVIRAWRELAEVRARRWAAERDDFTVARSYLVAHRGELTRVAIDWHHQRRTKLAPSDFGPVFAGPGWILDRPSPLSVVRLRLVEPPGRSDLPAYEALWPHTATGRRYRTYAEAIRDLDPEIASRMWSHASYRLLRVATASSGIRLDCSIADYYDHLNFGEALAFELAREATRVPADRLREARLNVRASLGDPASFADRPVLIGIDTLTIRLSASPTFFMHHRDAAKVAAAMNTFHVTPAGEFQPATDDPGVFTEELSPWRSIMREYAEEFLGVADAEGRGGRQPDYGTETPYAELGAAVDAGGLRPFVLGLVVDPLTLKADLLTACVFEAEVFDAIFGTVKADDSEGTKRVGARSLGEPFDERHVSGYIADQRTLAAGVACLALGWKGRRTLLTRRADHPSAASQTLLRPTFGRPT